MGGTNDGSGRPVILVCRDPENVLEGIAVILCCFVKKNRVGLET